MKTEITVEALPENLYSVQDALAPLLDECGFSLEARINLNIAIEELFINIASYAYAPETGKAVVTAETDSGGISITFSDRGKPFDPLAKPDPELDEQHQVQRVGGLGIYMVKQSMDKIEYRRQDGCNLLTIRKNA